MGGWATAVIAGIDRSGSGLQDGGKDADNPGPFVPRTEEGNRRDQTPAPVRCCPWWVSLNIRRGVESVLPLVDSF